jgi:hypothetical protein
MERWHEETSSFHMPAGEVTMTFDDVSCLLQLPNMGRLLDHGFLTRAEGEILMVDLLGSHYGGGSSDGRTLDHTS